MERLTNEKEPSSKSAKPYQLLRALGFLLLAVWAVWWVYNFSTNFMWPGRRTWIPTWNFIGLDFLHNYLGSTAWIHGMDPYTEDFGDRRGVFAYPPIVLRLFMWVWPLDFRPAVAVWLCAIAGVVAYATWLALKWRRSAGLAPIPASFGIAAVLLSTPVIFAMERGNSDALVLLCLVGAWLCSRKRSWLGDSGVGALVATAVWIKIYPAVLIAGLVAMRRYRAAGLALAGVVLIGGLFWNQTQAWVTASRQSQTTRMNIVQDVKTWITKGAVDRPDTREYPSIERCSHSLSYCWWDMWHGLFPPLSAMPGLVGAGAVLFGLAAWVGWHVWRSADPERVAYPWLLWCAGLATFWMPVSYDYNAFYLMIVAMALWDRRDPVYIHALVVPAILWWQPMAFNVSAMLFLAPKLLLLVAEGMLLVKRSRQTTVLEASTVL